MSLYKDDISIAPINQKNKKEERKERLFIYLFIYLLYSLFLLFFIVVQRLRTAHRRVDLAERGSSKLRCASECGKAEASSEVCAVEDGEAIGVKGFEDVARPLFL